MSTVRPRCSLDPAQHLPHRDARDRIEPGRRLVEKEDARLVDQPARDLHAAPHAARKVSDRLVRPRRQLDGLDELRNDPIALLLRHVVELRVDQQVLADAELHVARHRLRDHADRSAHVVGLANDVEAVDDRRARRRRQQRRHHADERRLARAVRPEQTEDLALLDAEAHALDGREVAEALDDVPDFDRVHDGLRSRAAAARTPSGRRRAGDRGCPRAAGSRTS